MSQPVDTQIGVVEIAAEMPLIPVRMVNEFVYCPRLAYLEWVQGEFAHNGDTMEGSIRHRRVDKPTGNLPELGSEGARIHARSVTLGSSTLGIIAKLDLVEGDGDRAIPIDYKRGKRPHVAAGAYDAERVQVCAQGLLLREHGYQCDEGMLYFVESKERVRIAFDAALIDMTLRAINGLREVARSGSIPAPLEDSPKCPRCSLVEICMPDEVRFLRQAGVEPRALFVASQTASPLYVVSPKAFVRKEGECFTVDVEKEKLADARIGEVSQVALFGYASMSAGALHECFRRSIPVSWHSYGGWFMGHTMGTGHRNVEARTHQYRASFDEVRCLHLARGWVAAKIANCRTIMRRNWRGTQGHSEEDDQFAVATPVDGEKVEGPPTELMSGLKHSMKHAERADSLQVLLGVEGNAASLYFGHFAALLKWNHDAADRFDFAGRNRRPPRDPVNAMLSFSYAMLTREWSIALSAVGLDPYRGFYHQPRYGRPSLALDMMEPFRPLIADSTVLTAINNEEVDSDDFIRSAAGCALTDTGRKRFVAVFERRMEQEVTHPLFKYRVSYRRLLEMQARLLIRYLAGEIPEFPNFVTR